MSHYTVAVITRKEPTKDMIDEIMAPYSENINVAPYVGETVEAYLKNKRADMEEYRTKGCYAEYIKDPDAYVENMGGRNPGHIEYLKTFMDRYNSTDEELLAERANDYKRYDSEDWNYGESFLDADGNRIDFYNPNSKWDWYSIGGRWNGLLNLKSGGTSNCAKIGDVDWGNEPDYDKYKNDPEFVDNYKKMITDGDGFYRASYLAKIYPTIEDYIRHEVSTTTFAVVDANGLWHEKGQMGWFACSSETPEEAVDWNRQWYDANIKNVNPEWYVTIVDCHI